LTAVLTLGAERGRVDGECQWESVVNNCF